MSVIPDSLKSISAYFKKADELDKDSSNPDSKIVAYSCRFYAIEKATSTMPNVLKDPDSKTYLLSQMSILEKEKTSITLTKQDRKLVCEAFAFKVFSLADETDRNGTVTKDTARTFNAATTFFDILEQFGELSSEIQEKRKYTKFKTVDILKALKEGRIPSRGAPGEEEISPSSLKVSSEQNPSMSSTFIVEDSSAQPNSSFVPPPSYTDATAMPSGSTSTNNVVTNISNYEIPAAPTSVPVVMPLPPFSEANSLPEIIRKPATTPSVQQPSPSVSNSLPKVNSNFSNGSLSKPNDKIKDDAIELCQFAIAALKKNDINLARERLAEALKRIS